MALNIKDRETEEVVRRLAQRTGLSITEAVKQAAADKLRRMDADYAETVARLTPEQLVKLRKLEEIGKRAAALPVHDDRPADEILGYDERGIWK
ncbi:MAG: type II toxin-antitoxin system VapB family antitoxin [Reyranella sp.]|uniref:type II toxin-antitoxin system VapB family antitoxin n=1 Tax=Reyranella sp. TaxID=1929291 RepID=UPI001AD2833B|nr:type II toxin-antitoxin system VapB family antitoxin [Reyranella sp.]MBN9087285.1 type II toxin-antitoxin system VapB family antitoxin [Reyranella sp.]